MHDVTALKQAVEEALGQDDARLAVAEVCAACGAALPATGAAFTVMQSDTDRQLVFASDPTADALEHAQFGLGEGPSLASFTAGQPILLPDVSDAGVEARWPTFARDEALSQVRALFCFPLRFGGITVGVGSLYRLRAGELSRDDLAFVLKAIDLTTLALLEARSLERNQTLIGQWLAADRQGRWQVHQATGMLMSQLGVSAETAFARLRGGAYLEGRDVEAFASDVVNRRVRLEPDVT